MNYEEFMIELRDWIGVICFFLGVLAVFVGVWSISPLFVYGPILMVLGKALDGGVTVG